MTIDDPIVRELHEADPAREYEPAPEADRAVLSRVLADGGSDRWSGPRTPQRWHRPRQALGLAAVLAVAVVVAAIAVLGAHHARRPTASSVGRGGTVTLVYEAHPSPASPHVTTKTLDETAGALRARVDQLGVSRARVRTVGTDLIAVRLSGVRDVARAEAELGTTTQLSFYDWEANVLLPGGRTVASALPGHDPRAERISRGARGGPGGPGGGGMSLYQAVELASRQPTAPDSARCSGSMTGSGCVTPSRLGAQFYLFAAPGTKACATAAGDRRAAPLKGEHCLLGGPESSIAGLRHDLVPGVDYTQGTAVAVPQGTTVLQASGSSSLRLLSFTDPAARYYVLRDRVALTGAQVAHPRAGRTASGTPDVSFGFTSDGARAFQRLTAQVAHRELDLGASGGSHDQHFMIAIDGRILSTPYIDARVFPDGVVSAGASSGGEITGGFSIQGTEHLAAALRLDTPQLTLTLLTEHR